METGNGGTSRQDKKILKKTLAKGLGDADLETRDGAYHRRDAFPPVAHRGNVVARHASHRRVFSAFTFTPSFMGARPAHDHRPRTRARGWSHAGRPFDVQATDHHDIRRAGANYVDETLCMPHGPGNTSLLVEPICVALRKTRKLQLVFEGSHVFSK